MIVTIMPVSFKIYRVIKLKKTFLFRLLDGIGQCWFYFEYLGLVPKSVHLLCIFCDGPNLTLKGLNAYIS